MRIPLYQQEHHSVKNYLHSRYHDTGNGDSFYCSKYNSTYPSYGIHITSYYHVYFSPLYVLRNQPTSMYDISTPVSITTLHSTPCITISIIGISPKKGFLLHNGSDISLLPPDRGSSRNEANSFPDLDLYTEIHLYTDSEFNIYPTLPCLLL